MLSICAINGQWECSKYLWRDIKSLPVCHIQEGRGYQVSWILLVASCHLSLYKCDGSPAGKSPARVHLGMNSSCFFWNVCGPSVQPTAPGGAALSSLVLGYWMCCLVHAMGQQSCLFLVLPVFPAWHLAAESHAGGCLRSQSPSCSGCGCVCLTLRLRTLPLLSGPMKLSS